MRMHDVGVRLEYDQIIIDQMLGDDPQDWAEIRISIEQAPILAGWLRRLVKTAAEQEVQSA